MRVAGSEAEGAWRRPARERLCSLQDPRQGGLEGVDCRFCGCTDAPVLAPVLDVESAEPAPKKKRLSRLEKRCEARLRAPAGGGGGSGSADPQAAVTGRRMLIGREVLVYLAEQPAQRGCL